jgi:hypothetical protein
MTGYAASLVEYQYDTPALDFQAQRPQFSNRRQRIGCENNVWAAQGTSDSRAESHVRDETRYRLLSKEHAAVARQI